MFEQQYNRISVCPWGIVSVLTPCILSIVSQVQAENDYLMQRLIVTRGDSEDLHSNVKAMKNAKQKAGAQRDQAKERKLKQVGRMWAWAKQKQAFSFFQNVDCVWHWFIYWLKIVLCHQDMYVERLTKDMERLMQQVAMYEAQTRAQAEETKAAREANSEVTTEWLVTVECTVSSSA